LGKNLPIFAHLPTLRNKDRKKLSKRRDPVDLRIFRKEGYLPQALINFLCLMGWSHPEEKEIFPIEEFIENFDLKRIRKAGPIFDTTKLDWINGEYIRKLSNSELLELSYEFLNKKYEKSLLEKVIPLIKERIKKLSEIETLAAFLLSKNPQPPIKIEPFFSSRVSKATILRLEKLDEKDWNLQTLNKIFEEIIAEVGYKRGDFYMYLRGAIAGSRITPPINESIEILGKEKTIERLRTLDKSQQKENN